MFPLGVAGGSQEMTKVVSSVDSASKLVTAVDTATIVKYCKNIYC